jgi:alginate O-acetyltransferase complex protein AlgJ
MNPAHHQPRRCQPANLRPAQSMASRSTLFDPAAFFAPLIAALLCALCALCPLFATLAALAPLLLPTPALAADAAPGIIGKDEWLYYRYEVSDNKDAAATQASIDLIARLNQVLARNNVTLAVGMVPLKMRIHAEHLPPELKLTDYLAGNYDRMNKALLAAGVQTVDLNSAFMNSPARAGENPLFIRLDTHWSPSGAMLAAETVRAAIDANPTLRKALAASAEEKFTLSWNKKKIAAKARDLVEQLPKGHGATFAPEPLLNFAVARAGAAKEGLVGDDAAPGVVLMGSSYSDNWTGFAEALRYTLQRDLLDISVGAERGTWYGIETYLRDASFQTQKPKLLIWEMPERDMKALPNYQYRDPRYLLDNTEWLLRVATWVESDCKASPVTAKIVSNPFAKAAPSKDGDAIEVEFSQPLDKLDYISAQIISNGGRSLTLEAAGAGGSSRKFTYPIGDDNLEHVFKTPLPTTGGAGFGKLRILPGKAKQFTFKQLLVCRHLDSLLK